MTRVHPIIVVSVIGAIAAFCILRVQFSASLYEMLPSDLPEVQGMDRLNRYFSRDGQLIVTVKADESYLAEEALLSLSETLESHPELIGEVFRELSLTELVTEGGGLLAWLWLNGSADDLATLTARLSRDQSGQTLAEAMDALHSGFLDQDIVVTSYDPLGFSKIGGLLGDDGESGTSPDPMSSTDGTYQVMYVEGNGVDFSNYRDANVWLKQVKTVVANWKTEWAKAHPNNTKVTVGLTGTPAFMAEVGTEMERDMTISVIATMLLISLLFFIMHRQTKPLSWLVSAMLAILAVTILIGGLIFGDLSVMSAGFAAILMGLAVDYGIVLYREAMESKGDAKALRRTVGPSILWAAATTAVVFLSLNLSSLPGLSEMGNLVAMGVVIGALIMLFGFAPVAVSFNKDIDHESAAKPSPPFLRKLAGILAIVVPILGVLSVVTKEMPSLEANFHPFRIRESPSMIAWQQLQKELVGRENAIPSVITGDSIEGLHAELTAATARIEAATEKGLLTEFVLPTVFIPQPVHQKGNIDTIRQLLGERERLLGELDEVGFSEEGKELTTTVFDAWETYLTDLETQPIALPTGKLAEWSIDRLFAEKDGVYAALATMKPATPQDRAWVEAVASEHTVVASLGSLGTALNERIGQDVVRVFLPMIGLLSLMLALVFRNGKNLILSLFSIVFTASIMLILTIWTPLSWNSFNICGLPLLFGTGLDFSIHMIFALQRGAGADEARQRIAKALLFCGTSSAIGFGSLATASAYGLASLGIVCAVGILANMIVAVWLLPQWYRWMHRL